MEFVWRLLFPFCQLENIYPYAHLHERIKHEMKDMDVICLDLHEALNGERRKDIWSTRLHPNAKGYEIASKEMFKFLVPNLDEAKK